MTYIGTETEGPEVVFCDTVQVPSSVTVSDMKPLHIGN